MRFLKTFGTLCLVAIAIGFTSCAQTEAFLQNPLGQASSKITGARLVQEALVHNPDLLPVVEALAADLEGKTPTQGELADQDVADGVILLAAITETYGEEWSRALLAKSLRSGIKRYLSQNLPLPEDIPTDSGK